MNTRAPEPGPALTDRIIRRAIKVHRALGPGLLESIYQECLCWELAQDGLTVRREVPLPIVYAEMRFDKGYRADVIVDDSVLLELKSVPHLLPLHKAQVLTYLHLSGCAVALLMNFNCVLLKDGPHRFIARGGPPLTRAEGLPQDLSEPRANWDRALPAATGPDPAAPL
jgi:GxxExxY protein